MKNSFLKILEYLKAHPVITAVVLLLLLVIISTWFRSKYDAIKFRRFQQKQAEQLRAIQETLADAEARIQSAEAKEAQAKLLAEQNTAKATTTRQMQEKITNDQNRREAEVTERYEDDLQRIRDPTVDDCARCRDIRARLERLKAGNPSLQSAIFDCDSVCQQ